MHLQLTEAEPLSRLRERGWGEGKLQPGSQPPPSAQPTPSPGIALMLSGSNPASSAKWRPRAT